MTSSCKKVVIDLCAMILPFIIMNHTSGSRVVHSSIDSIYSVPGVYTIYGYM